MPLAVMVEVTTLVAVVEAVQPDQVVQGAAADHVPDVQPANHSSQYMFVRIGGARLRT